MKLLFASDSFKGTISSKESSQMLTQAAHEVFGADVECHSITIADGGEGTAEAVISAVGGEMVSVSVHGPRWKKTEAHYGLFLSGASDDTAASYRSAIIEMAQASGLPLLADNERDPMLTTTFGTGELILDALNRGIGKLYIAIGGSATNDGGIGCMRALGVRFLDAQGQELEGIGSDLIRIDRIDISGMDKRLLDCDVTVMCDVTNPLCGPEGATYTFSAQKGATTNMQSQLESGMCHYRNLITETLGINPDDIPGSGAAGGLGAALLVFLHARLQSGIETVLALTHFDSLAKESNLVITGEGRTDWQSAHGKVLYGVGTHCQRLGIPAVALVGSIGDGADAIYQHGILSIFTTVPAPMPLEQALTNAHRYYRDAAIRMFRLVKAGMSLQKP